MPESAKLIDILYLCDGKQCVDCSKPRGLCHHTTDIEHAVNKDKLDESVFCYSPYVGDNTRLAFIECMEDNQI